MKEFEKIKSQLKQIGEITEGTTNANLWNQEAIVRKKIKALKAFQDKNIQDFDKVTVGYLQLLDKISVRVLANYNKKNQTDFQFEEIVSKDRGGYVSSGILSVLITNHIPELVADEFNKYFPENPKEEYEEARKLKRKVFLHLGDTNTGKTFHALERLKTASNGVYLAPLRILALEVYEKLNKDQVPCHLITGEEEIITEGAKHISSTIEKLNIHQSFDVAVIDEIQMIDNSQRGQGWTRALLGLCCEEIHICGALNAKDLIVKILTDCGDTYEIKEYKRLTRLEIEEDPFELKQVRKGDALVEFSKKRVLFLYKLLMEKGIKPSVIYGDLPPEVRKMQYESFISGESGVLVTTDAIGMGVNLPIRRILFMSIQKFDGDEVRYLTRQEVKQIAGRAGRIGIYETGYVGACNTLDCQYIADCLEKKDTILSEAVLEPSEAILKIHNLPLNEKIALWSTRQEKLEYYRKMDIRDYLLLLESIKSYHLSEEIQFRLMRLPFDVNQTELLLCFITYVEEYFVRKRMEIQKPDMTAETLFSLETYYQKINLYYSFCKSFKIEFDEQWVYTERATVSKRINSLLLKY